LAISSTASTAARSPTLGALAEPIRIEDVHFTPPERPGHGIIFDRATLAAHASDAGAERVICQAVAR
jgi:L-alanine-DL-glutamate epimerase-like enolase superfamily enzyme